MRDLAISHPMESPIDQVIHGQALDVLRRMPSQTVQLVYIDPPFGTGTTRRLDSIVTGSGEKNRRGFNDREYLWHIRSSHSYSDGLDLQAYVGFLREHLAELHRILADDGSLYLHLDFHSVHYGRLILDDIFGPDRFLNEIIWAYDYGGRRRYIWPRKHDNILWYAKSNTWIFNRDDVDRLPYMAPTLVGVDKAAAGKLPTDVWWMTIVPTNSKERTGYPTQKPEKLLERIIRASSMPGATVLDCFAGSGTTGVAASRLGRRYVLVDSNPEAVRISNERLSRGLGLWTP